MIEIQNKNFGDGFKAILAENDGFTVVYKNLGDGMKLH